MKDRIYLDHAATTFVAPKVRSAMRPYLQENFGNASAMYAEGRKARHALEDARRTMAKILNASKEEILFTSSGTESDNWAIRSAARALRKQGRDHLITSCIEHPAVLNTIKDLEEDGFTVTYLKVDRDGLVDLKQLEEAIGEKTALVSIMMVNNEIGTIQKVKEISAICHEKKVLFHTDAVQAVGRLSIDVKELGVDMLSASAHKFYGPKGTGFLYISSSCSLLPYMTGGRQERGLRAGTENTAGIVGMAAALAISEEEREAASKKLRMLEKRLIRGLVPEHRTEKDPYLVSTAEDKAEGIVNICFTGFQAESMLILLDMEGISVSAGSACEAGSIEASHVLKALGLGKEDASSCLRFSLGRENTRTEIDKTIETMKKIMERLNKFRR